MFVKSTPYYNNVFVRGNPISPISVIVPNDCVQNDNTWDDLQVRLGLKAPCPKIINTVPVIINKTHRNYFNNSPYYTLDILPTIKNDYSDLNDDKSIIRTVTKYYYYKTLEKFLKSDMIDLLGYLKITDDKVNFIKSVKDHSDKLPSEADTNKKINYLENYFLTKKMIHGILKKYVQKNDIMWYKVQHNEQEFKNYLHKKLKELIEDEIKY